MTKRFTWDAFLAVLEHARDAFDPEHPEVPRTMREWLSEFLPEVRATSEELEHLAEPEGEDDET